MALNGLVMMEDSEVICASTLDHQLRFYRYASTGGFDLCSVIVDLPHMASCLAYNDECGEKIAFGDRAGNVFVLALVADKKDGDPFRPQNSTETHSVYRFSDLAENTGVVAETPLAFIK